MPEEEILTWGDIDYLVPRLSSSTRVAVARKGQAVSILFDDAELDLQLKGPMEAYWTSGLISLIEPADASQYVCQVRGFILKTAGSRAMLTVSIGGQTATREFGYGTALDEQEIEAIDIEIDASKLAGRRVVVFVALYAERQTFEDFVRIALDSADSAGDERRITIAKRS